MEIVNETGQYSDIWILLHMVIVLADLQWALWLATRIKNICKHVHVPHARMLMSEATYHLIYSITGQPSFGTAL